MTKRGKVQNEHFTYFSDLLRQIEWDLHQEVLDERRIPPLWNEIAKAKGQAEKVRLTIRVDGDVVRFFRRFGRGYQQRMNDVLAAWMHGRLAGLIEGPDAQDVFRQIKAFGRPRIGEGAEALKGRAFGSDGKLRDLDTWEVVEDEDP